MSKDNIVNEISDIMGTTKVDAGRFLDAFCDVVRDHVKKGKKFSLKKLCTIEVKYKPATTAKNPRTGEPVDVAAKNVVKIKPSKELSDAANSNS